jgi:glycosyltransferase involved in cell wall biosynthesis
VGLRVSDAELVAALGRAGARTELTVAEPQRQVRTLALTDLLWARAARRAAQIGLERHRPRAVVYSTATAALLWPRPGAIRLDATAAANRPGRHGLWQRPLERRRLAESPLLVPTSPGALEESGLQARSSVIVPIPVEPSRGPSPQRDIAAITYAANPAKKGLDRILEAWRRARRDGEELAVAGLEESVVAGLAGADPASIGVRAVGRLDPASYRGLLRRARVYVAAVRREDYGIAQLEALADGCVLVTTAAPGPYAALPLARELDARLVGDDLAAALRTALDDPRPDYAANALTALEPFGRPAVDRIVRERLLPALLA